MRKIVLLTIAASASGLCTLDGVLSWMAMGSAFRSPAFVTYCALLAAAILAFLLYLRLPLVAMALAWILPSAIYICLVLIDFEMCRRRGCPTTNPYQIAWEALRNNAVLFLLLLAPPVCMLMDYTSIAPPASLPAPSPRHDHDRRR